MAICTWAKEELETIDIGDSRLNKRTQIILDNMAKKPGSSIPQCFQTSAEVQACYRFLENHHVTPGKILKPHIQSTVDRIKQQEVVFLISDTTSIDYSGKNGIEGLGTLESPVNTGFFLHPTFAVTRERVGLGIVDAKIWTRNNEVPNRSLSTNERNNQPIEEKESYKWIESYRKACHIAKEAPDTQIISIHDREADIYELFLEANNQKKAGKAADLIVRANHDRRLDLPDLSEADEKNLKKKLAKAEGIGKIKFTIPKTKKRKAREVEQTLKAISVTFKEKKITGKIFPKVHMNAILAIEENPPEGEEPLKWIILTTLPIDTAYQVACVIEYYLARWEIEVLFKVLKSGCEIEKRHLQSIDKLSNLTMLFLIVAWRVMYLMMMGRKCPDLPCTVVFEEAEWKSVYKISYRNKPLPDNPPLLGDFIKLVACLGGYLGRKNDPPPGPKVIWKGLKRVMDFALAWEVFS